MLRCGVMFRLRFGKERGSALQNIGGERNSPPMGQWALRMSRRVAGAMVGVLALSGCALDTRLPKPDLRLPSTFEAGATDRAETLAPQALDQWWTLFGDAQLTELITQALSASPDARTAMARLKEAGATVNETLYGLLPQGDLKGSGTQERVTTKYRSVPASLQPFLGAFGFNGNEKLYSGSLNVSWELDLFGRDITAIQTARADLAAARFDYEATRMSLAANVASALFQARGLAIQLDDAKENARLNRDLATVGRRKSDHGIGSTADAARLESAAASAEAQVEQLDAELKGAKRALLILIGRGADASSSLPVDARAFDPPPVPVTAPGDLITRRPDVREAEAKVRSAAGRLHLDKLAVLPTFTLLPSGTYSRQEAQYTTITQTSALGVGASVPLLSLPKLLAEVRAQGARGEQAVIAYEKAVQSAYGDAEKGLTTLKADETRLGLLKTAADKSRFAYDAARTGYGLGLTDLTSLVQAEQGWRAAQSAYTGAQTAALVDAVTTFKALGGGWAADRAGPGKGTGR